MQGGTKAIGSRFEVGGEKRKKGLLRFISSIGWIRFNRLLLTADERRWTQTGKKMMLEELRLRIEERPGGLEGIRNRYKVQGSRCKALC